jgi:hypothetical protein
LPTLDYPDKTQGVTLACSKTQEAVRPLPFFSILIHSHVPRAIQATYRDRTGNDNAYNLLSHVVHNMDTHFIYGAVDDYMFVFGISLLFLERLTWSNIALVLDPLKKKFVNPWETNWRAYTGWRGLVTWYFYG